MLSAFVAYVLSAFPELIGARVLVALSGGGDSTALLHLLAEGRPVLGCHLVAAHVHHHARGGEADADAAFCAALAQRLGVPFVRRDVGRLPARGESREAFWRRERYAALETARREADCDLIATAHTLDDQAETVLLQLLRGAGPRGVAGIRARRGPVFRPLLCTRREALRRWLASRGEPWREDASNADRTAPRGAVRHVVMPMIVARWPRAAEHLATFAATLAEDEELLASLAPGGLRFPSPTDPILVAELAGLPRPVRARWLLALASRLPLAEPPSRRQLDAALAMLAGGAPAAVDLGRRWVLRRRGVNLCLSPPPLARFGPVLVAVPSEVTLPGGFVGRLGAVTGGGRHAARLLGSVASGAVSWRSVRPGERLADGTGARIGKRLAAAGVPTEWRAAWPVLEADGTIVWVPGLHVSPQWAGDEASGVSAELEEPWSNRSRS